MLYYSTKNKNLRVPLKKAVYEGLAEDGGLYMPEYIPQLPEEFIKNIHGMSLEKISLKLAKSFFEEDIPALKLKKIVEESMTFPIPLIRIHDNIYSLELFHGPTLAFKDVGARFMARLLAYFLGEEKRELKVLVATSGDTGSAVANGFLDVKGISVVILYPSGKVSEIQEKQLTTLGRNITALEVMGTFDDCQALVKQAFADKELNAQINLTSANSINIARLIPQSFYYFYAYSQLPQDGRPVIISVPSGNFGNLSAGLIAKKMGLPVSHFIAATNANDIVPKYLLSGRFEPRPSIQTLSNAMDVGNPSNFARMFDLYNGDLTKIKMDISGFSYSDEFTKNAIKEVFNKFNYLLDPHGAIGYMALKEFSALTNANAIFLETAHPAKFIGTTQECISSKVDLPKSLENCLLLSKKSIMMENSFLALKNFLLK